MTMTDTIRVLFVTHPVEGADAFVRTLCKERLVACGNIVPDVSSQYWWQGSLESATEAAIWMETTAARLPAAMARIEELHPYDCPKIIAMQPAAVNAAYAAWVEAETSES